MTHARGFTLIEVLVAVAVIAVALGGAIKSVSDSARNVDYLTSRTLATWVAMNVITARVAGLDSAALARGAGRETMGGREFHYQVRRERLRGEGIDRVIVEVADTEGKVQSTVTSYELTPPDTK